MFGARLFNFYFVVEIGDLDGVRFLLGPLSHMGHHFLRNLGHYFFSYFMAYI